MAPRFTGEAVSLSPSPSPSLSLSLACSLSLDLILHCATSPRGLNLPCRTKACHLKKNGRHQVGWMAAPFKGYLLPDINARVLSTQGCAQISHFKTNDADYFEEVINLTINYVWCESWNRGHLNDSTGTPAERRQIVKTTNDQYIKTTCIINICIHFPTLFDHNKKPHFYFTSTACHQINIRTQILWIRRVSNAHLLDNVCVCVFACVCW